MKKILGTFALFTMLTAPVAMFGQESRRYEDKQHHDSHEWNSNEDQAYKRYLAEHHKKTHEFAKAPKREQSDYWNWRHAHPDNDHR
jgi:hypothetical protein